MQSHPQKVLVVEDDPLTLRLLSQILNKASFLVTECCDGNSALAEIKRECPDYLITDWNLPGTDGIELCKFLRSAELPHYVYSILITASSRLELMVESLSTGADDFIRKPILPEELLARLKAGSRIIELERDLRHMASHDPLTGAINRRTLFVLLPKEWTRAKRYGCRLSCAMVDIDNFKAVNDAHGHLVGDSILKHVAKTLEAGSRTPELVCRYGGEEFCILLPETSEDGALVWAERCRQAIANSPALINGESMHVTASFGVAEFENCMQDPEDLIEAADWALLMAKQLGKNRTVTYRQLQDSKVVTTPLI